MKKNASTILILLISAALAATSGHASATTSSKKKKLSSAAAKLKSPVLSLELRNSINASAKLRDPDLLYNPANTEYVKSNSLFSFGPKSQNIKYDKRMIMAAEIAAERAHKHSTMRCWAYVKNALVSANVISSRPTTGYAKQAGEELQSKYGFQKLPITDPYQAPLGSVLVYGGKGAGHVEIRTTQGFVSDFTNTRPSRRPLIGVYVKPS